MNAKNLQLTLELVLNGDMFDFDLGTLKIDGQRVFDIGTMERDEMPQLKGTPYPGSISYMLNKAKNGKIDITEYFIDYLERINIEMEHTTLHPQQLRGSQCELLASKVAKHTLKMLEAGKDVLQYKKLQQTYIVSRDDMRLLDGHHGWAAARCYELITGTNLELNVLMVKQPIENLIHMAKRFTQAVGIQNKAGL